MLDTAGKIGMVILDFTTVFEKGQGLGSLFLGWNPCRLVLLRGEVALNYRLYLPYSKNNGE